MPSVAEFQNTLAKLGEKAKTLQAAHETENAASNVFNIATAERHVAEENFKLVEKEYHDLLNDLKDKGFESDSGPIVIPPPTTEEQLVAALNAIKGKLMATVDQVLAEVAETTGVVNSAITFISGVKDELAAVKAELASSGVNSAKLDEVIAGLDTNQNNLAAAIATPQPAPVPDIPATDPPPADPVADPAAPSG